MGGAGGGAVLGAWNDLTPAISPDSRHLFFASDRPVPGRAKAADVVWGKPVPLRIDGPARDHSPRLSPDGRYLFFASERGLPTAADRPRTYRQWIAAFNSTLNGLGNIYQVDLAAALPRR